MISAANTLLSWMSARTALTSSTTRPAEIVEVIGRVGGELSAEDRAQRPNSGEPGDRPQRPAAVVGSNSGQPQQRQRQQDRPEDGADDRADLDQLRLVRPTKERNVSMPFPS